MRTFIKILIILIILAAVFIVSIPASVLDSNLAKATREEWRLAQTSGTIWKGSGMLVRAPDTIVIPIHWRFEPSALLRGMARWHLESQQAVSNGIDAVLTIRRGGIDIEGLRFSAQAVTLSAFFPKDTVVQALDGRLVVDSPLLSLNEKRQTGNIKGSWSDAHITLYDTPVALGDVSFNFNADEQGQSGNISNRGGALQLEGFFSGSSSTDATQSGAKGRLKITPRPNAPPEIVRLLSMLGQSDANGAYVLEIH
ncbi:MAG: type II secretion system protein N [Burkholderiales bacterium]|jgi:hypothetical protein|nr:type II secretion system protein N [Burkholderiales bacterium]